MAAAAAAFELMGITGFFTSGAARTGELPGSTPEQPKVVAEAGVGAAVGAAAAEAAAGLAAGAAVEVEEVKAVMIRA